MSGKIKLTSWTFLVAGILVMISIGISVGAKASRQNALIERGKYLAELGGCVMCHTPIHYDHNTGAMMPDIRYYMAGTPEGTLAPKTLEPNPSNYVLSLSGATRGTFGTSFAANLTPDKESGIGSWTFQEFKKVIRSQRYKSQWSHRGDGRPLMPPMSWQIYGTLTDDDLQAIFAYLQSLHPIHNRVPEYIPPTR